MARITTILYIWTIHTFDTLKKKMEINERTVVIIINNSKNHNNNNSHKIVIFCHIIVILCHIIIQMYEGLLRQGWQNMCKGLYGF